MTKRLKTFLVYMLNNTYKDDDEVYKVKAKNEEDAKKVANSFQEWKIFYGLVQILYC